jgi:hypothetical protein
MLDYNHERMLSTNLPKALAQDLTKEQVKTEGNKLHSEGRFEDYVKVTV